MNAKQRVLPLKNWPAEAAPLTPRLTELTPS